MRQDRHQRAGGDALNAGGLTQGSGAGVREFRANLIRESADLRIVQRVRNAQAFISAEGVDVPLLPLEVTCIGRVNRQIFNRIRVEL